MAAKFEVYMESDQYFHIQQCNRLFPPVGVITFSPNYLVWDSWLPTQEVITTFQDDRQIQSSIRKGNIVQVQASANSSPMGGRQSFECGTFCTELWLDTARFPQLDTNGTNAFCRRFCRSVTQQILALDPIAELTFFAMGTEMIVDGSGSLDEIVQNSHNIMCCGTKKQGRFLILSP